ncbi:hypothetical protein BR93DRAFT_935009 [Coniochaeta sp. PMI_546]|nr:hypothetical protein BR93DRAFT_935009 [Coniochaeta sp. PMI_546]
MHFSRTLLLVMAPLVLAATVPKCDDTSPARIDWTNDCVNELVASGSDTLVISDSEKLVCYKVWTEPLGRGGGTYWSSVVVRRRDGHDDTYTTTKGDVACAVKAILDACRIGDNLTGGRYGVCNSEDLVVEVKGKGN